MFECQNSKFESPEGGLNVEDVNTSGPKNARMENMRKRLKSNLISLFDYRIYLYIKISFPFSWQTKHTSCYLKNK